MSNTPKFSKKTYEMVAQVLSTNRGQLRIIAAERYMLAEDFSNIFRVDNPRFDHIRFMIACSGEKK